MWTVNRRNSIYVQLLRLLFLSACFALGIFFLFDTAGQYFVENYLEETNYIEKKDQKYVKMFQEYIKEEELCSQDTVEINKWIKNQKKKIVSLQIYKEDKLVFDSEYPEEYTWEEDTSSGKTAWDIYYSVYFVDGVADISLLGTYSYEIYNYVFIIAMILSFVTFLFAVLLGIRKKMAYILKLSDEIGILEGGSLDYPITIEGKDEISELAEGLDHMRLSFVKLIEQEADMVRENQRIITEMSHDIRTPVTSILLYTEILKKGKYKSKEQLLEYLDKIDKKAHQMKQLTDHLFEYSLIAEEGKVVLEEPEAYGILFYDLFSETCNYLQQKGFQVDFQVQWKDYKMQISTEYVMRIMDNITSNLIKYADISYPILISSVSEKNMAGFLFENRIGSFDEKVDSTGIGLQNIKNMMQKMGGKCVVEKKNETFRLVLLFPCL